MAQNEIIYQDLGLATLSRDAERLLEQVVHKAALDVEREMKRLIVERDFVDTRATVNSVQVERGTDRLERDIGPTTEYAIYGELGYHQTHAWGKRLAQAIYHPGLHFARDALQSVRASFVAAIEAALGQLGKRA